MNLQNLVFYGYFANKAWNEWSVRLFENLVNWYSQCLQTFISNMVFRANILKEVLISWTGTNRSTSKDRFKTQGFCEILSKILSCAHIDKHALDNDSQIVQDTLRISAEGPSDYWHVLDWVWCRPGYIQVQHYNIYRFWSKES